MNIIFVGALILSFMFLGIAAFPDENEGAGPALPAFLGILVFFACGMIGAMTDSGLWVLLLGYGFLIYRAVKSK